MRWPDSTRSWFGLILLLLAAQGALGEPQKIRVTVSIPPQAYFLEQIGGDRVDVQVLLRPGDSPATFQPTIRQLRRLADSKIYFRIGVPFEETLLPKLESTLQRLSIVDTRKNIPFRSMEEHDHSDQPANHHQHDHVQDPHFWLCPLLVKIQAKTIRDALTRIDPESRERWSANYLSLAKDLDRLDTEIRAILKPFRGASFYAYHPAYGYFADTYGLKQRALESAGKEPTPRQLHALIKQAKQEQARVIFVQPQFNRRSAATVARAIQASVVPMDPLARDYPSNLKNMAKSLARGLNRPDS